MDRQVEELLRSAMGAYRAALKAMADAGAQACPPTGEGLKQNLLNLQRSLTAEASAAVVAETEQHLEEELREWGQRTARFYEQKTDEIKEVLTIIAQATGHVAERDERYAAQFGALTEQLETTAKLNDLTAIRQSLVRGVADLRTKVARMAKEGQDSVAKLRSQVAVYAARLEEVERLASQDPLTGLANRRRILGQLELRISQGRRFSVICLDLNDFKQINDRLGHEAGDDVLKQFSEELKAALRSTDIVGRWGGDEFIILIDGEAQEADASVGRVKEWVNGEYTLTKGAKPHKASVVASAGIATWRPGEKSADVLQRADAAMYEDKSCMAKAAAEARLSLSQ
jgi:diguanylate cyclase